MAVRVSLKNTFLAFEGEDGEIQQVRQAASPRSRSAEAPMSPKLQARQEFDGPGSGRASPGLGSPGRGSPGNLTPRQRAGSGHFSPGCSFVGGDGEALPSDPGRPSDATDTQIDQLQRSLEDIYHHGQRPHRSFKRVSSHGSISSMGMSDSGDEGDDKRNSIPRVCSFGSDDASFKSVGSDFGGNADFDESGGPVEFDLNIEEEPVQDCPLPRSSAENKVQKPHRQAPPTPQDTAKNQSMQESGQQMALPQHSSSSQSSAGYTVAAQGQKGQQLQRGAPPKEYRHGHVPKNVDLAEEYKKTTMEKPPTTLMIRNIPNRYTQNELILELEALGFGGTFDFLYVPLDKGTMSNVGYAFVNFVDPQSAAKCMESFHGYHFKRHRKVSGKIAAVSIAHLQGLEANLAHYKNAAVNTAKMKQRRPLVMANISNAISLSDALDGSDANERVVGRMMQELQL